MHVISTALLGITAVTMANTIAGEETVHKLASLLLVFLGGSYILLFLCGKGGHSHSHHQPMEKMVLAGLVLVPALSPCATTLTVFLAVGKFILDDGPGHHSVVIQVQCLSLINLWHP